MKSKTAVQATEWRTWNDLQNRINRGLIVDTMNDNYFVNLAAPREEVSDD